MANPYYASGHKLKTKNLLAGGAAVEVPKFALSRVRLDDVVTAVDACECDVLEETRSIGDAGAFLSLYLQTGGYDWASRDDAIPPRVREQIATAFLDLTRRWIEQEGAITAVTRWAAFVARSPRARV